MKIDWDFEKAAGDAGWAAVASAFRKSTFLYGTQGKGSSAVMAFRMWAARTLNRPLNLFDPGVRIGTYLAAGVQMMDMYYGQQGNSIHTKRDPAIARFIHKVMGYSGDFNIEESGRDAFMRSTRSPVEGWQSGGPTYNNGQNTATVEISRAIRWGIERFGGKLIFEGKEVFYSQVFKRSGYKGDTDREAIALFGYFHPGASTVPFGQGDISFYWNGREQVPTHCHFLSNWGFPLSRVKQTVEILEAEGRRTGAQIPSINQYASKQPWEIGALHHHALNRGNLQAFSELDNIDMNWDLWQKFLPAPVGFENLPLDQILRHL